jgi:primosomal protein N' (replication factor Y)
VETPAAGSRVRIPFGSGTETGFVISVRSAGSLDPALRRQPNRIREIGEVLDPFPWLDASLLSLGRWIADYYGSSLGEALRAMVPVRPLIRPRAVPEIPEPEAAKIPRLTREQSLAMDELHPFLDKAAYASFLLHGTTGSGKTEIYLRSIEKVIARGKQAIVLVPEISLTPQMARRFRERLGTRVGIFHSGLSASERFGVWTAARKGDLSVVLGPRSAVFAPFSNLGLVILDEEHDSSYKQSEKPRYHARSVALMRARRAGVPVILGSATPSLESLHNVDKGKFRLLELPHRVAGGHRPRIEIVDLCGEEDGLFSLPLASALEECLARGEKAMLLLNRRGHSRLRLCASCGEVLKCSRCDISLTYHSGRNRLLCHYCGQERALPKACPECGKTKWNLSGLGIEQVEMDLKMRFPGYPVLRMDFDSTRKKGAHATILAEFSQPGPSLLLGTQMIAKGHHIPEVTLVGVISADTGLFLPDFRAAERSWQLLEQVSGRSGRGDLPGRVMIQTWHPEHRVLGSLSRDDASSFLEEELQERRQLAYPPWKKLSSLLVSAPQETLALRAAELLIQRFYEQWPRHRLDILGPVEALLPRLKGRFRQQILFKGNLSREQKAWFPETFSGIQKELRRSGALQLEIDVDPEALL